MEKIVTVVDVAMPKGWQELTQKQLRYFFIRLDSEDSIEAVVTKCFLKWGGVKVVARSNDRSFFLRKKNLFFSVSPEDLWQWMKPVHWLMDVPEIPVVLTSYGKHKAVDAQFRHVPFGTYLECIANWTDMMHKGEVDQGMITELCVRLYGFRPRKIKREFVGCIVYWMTSIQSYFAKRFKDLFAEQSSSDGQGSLGSASTSLQDSINAMIRALTKGDVLKEKKVLEIDTWRALIELDAQARESRQINESIKKK